MSDSKNEYWADGELSGAHREIAKEVGRRNKDRILLSMRGPNHPAWKGGQMHTDGYVYLLRPDHPNCNKRGYIPRSHLVMENHIGRYLKPGEVVHHEGERDDDRIEMLILFPLNKDHLAYHRLLKKGGEKRC